jgi:hypothetical protein
MKLFVSCFNACPFLILKKKKKEKKETPCICQSVVVQ